MTRAKIKKQLAICERRQELLIKKIEICDRIIEDENKRKNALKKESAKNMLYCNSLINRYYSENE